MISNKTNTTNKKESIFQILSASKYLTFYKIMKYPVPLDFEHYFFWKKTITTKQTNQAKDQTFSRKTKNQHLDDYIKHINKYWRLYKNIPFIKDIYLCNSITFNALHPKSDIDLFIITKNNAIWRARFFSVIIFAILWIKRGGTKKIKRFCLSFYITEQNKNLYSISLPHLDIYLCYRLSHLVPLYQEKKQNDSQNIYKNNERRKSMMPNHSTTHKINIGNQQHYWKWITKKLLEFFCWGLLWKLAERLIKLIRSPIVISKSHKHKTSNIIINDNMLKFHKDIRQKIHLLYKTHDKQ